ncbi:DUF4169 family protein [Bosea sp. 117]|uniref:DUF4169 family protein n=1 Tax=Bosea sp. 117 TaxID=1125973 RepID=UPI0009DE70AB|nr:DUF4169 family protein [Bosea sp. 117]
MADIINLRRARKNKARAEAEQKAAAQRSKFGRSKVEREVQEAARRRHEAALEGHRLQGDET